MMNNDEQPPNSPEQARVMMNKKGMLSKVLVVMAWGLCVGMVMAWGYGRDSDYIPFLADGNYGVMGRGVMRWNFS